MAFTLTQLDAIETAIAAGVTNVSYDGGKSVQYRTLQEMMTIRDYIRRALGLAPASSATVLVSHDRGFPGPSTFGDDGLQSGF